MKKALLAALLIAGCKDTIQHQGPDASPDSTPPDTMGSPAPMLGCNPATAPQGDLCGCMATIVCDQIYYCLSPVQLAAKPSYWSPKAACVTSLQSDCADDMDSSPVDYFPTDFRQCIADIATATCSDYGTFSSVANDFPASCDNLRALDTGLGIAQ